MYSLCLLAAFSLLVVNAKQLTVDNTITNDRLDFDATFQNHRNISPTSINFGFNPSQFRELENGLNAVVTNFIGPQPRKLRLRSTGDPNAGLANTLEILGQGISSKVQSLSERFGLLKPARSDYLRKSRSTNPNLKTAIYYNLLRAPLILSPIWREVQKRLRSHHKKKSYIKMGYTYPKREFKLYETSNDELKISAIFGTVSKYSSHIYNCLDGKLVNSFNTKKALGTLMNYPPEKIARIVSKRLDQKIPKSPGNKIGEYTYIHAFICRTLVGNFLPEFRNCLVEIKRIDKCVQTEVNDSSHLRERKKSSSKDFIQSIRSLNHSCKKSDNLTEVLSGCKVKHRATQSNVFPNIVDFFVGDLRKSPNLRQMATKVGSILMRNEDSAEVIDQVATLIEIQKYSQKKKAEYMRAAQRDPRLIYNFNKISASLDYYQQHLSNLTEETIKNIQNFIVTIEKILVDSASTLEGQNKTMNSDAVRSWTRYIHSILVDWADNKSAFQSTKNHLVEPNSNMSGKQSASRRGLTKSRHAKPSNQLIVSMKRLGTTAPPRRSTLLGSLAKTFLFATVFYESMVFLAWVIFRDDSKPMLLSNNVGSEETPIDFDDYRIDGEKYVTTPPPTTHQWRRTTSSPPYEEIEERNEADGDNQSNPEYEETDTDRLIDPNEIPSDQSTE